MVHPPGPNNSQRREPPRYPLAIEGGEHRFGLFHEQAPVRWIDIGLN